MQDAVAKRWDNISLAGSNMSLSVCCLSTLTAWLRWRLLDVLVGAWLCDPDNPPDSFSQVLGRFNLKPPTDNTVRVLHGRQWSSSILTSVCYDCCRLVLASLACVISGLHKTSVGDTNFDIADVQWNENIAGFEMPPLIRNVGVAFCWLCSSLNS